MIDPPTLAIVHDILRRESRSFAQYVGDSLPWPANDGAEVEQAVTPLLDQQRQALGELYRLLARHHAPPPYIGSFPSAFTTRNFISLQGLLPFLIQDEQRLIATLERDLSAIGDVEVRRIVSHLLENKRTQLRHLEHIQQPIAAVT